MRRSDFIKEMAGSLFHTVKSVYEPLIGEDMEKLEKAADRVMGITWYPVIKERDGSDDLEMKYIVGTPVIVVRNGTNMLAFDGVCPVCSNIIVVTALYSRGKCLNCQKEYNFKTLSGELHLKSYPIKKGNGTYFIGLQKEQKLGGSYA